jgi:hypothetical protein
VTAWRNGICAAMAGELRAARRQAGAAATSALAAGNRRNGGGIATAGVIQPEQRQPA